MREILFRGKREYKDKEWAFGSLHSEYGETDKNGQRKIDYRILGMRGECDYVLPETVGQLTGLTDKNGKKIFEGDIILYKIPDGSYAYGIVKFRETNEVGFCVEWFNRHDSGWLRNDIGFWAKYREIEVIGNIHDNPELLGGTEDG